MTRPDIDECAKALMRNNALKILGGIEGQNKFGTGPIRNGYIGMTHTDLCGSRGLDNVDGFIHYQNYPDPNKAHESEWGSAGNIRFLVSSVGSTSPAASVLNATVYNTFVTGMEAYCVVEQDNMSSQFIYLPPQFSGPLAQNVTLGYKFMECPRILNDAWITNLRSTLAAA